MPMTMWSSTTVCGRCYDAALTNQGRDDDEIGIIYRHNIIWQAEYSFEFWNRGRTENILFEFNTCVDAGDCWSHNQRPDPNGAHLMFYNNRSATTNFVIRNNIFCRSSDRCTRMFNDWREGLTLNNNLYWSPDKPIMRWMEKTNLRAIGLRPLPVGVGDGSSFARWRTAVRESRRPRLPPQAGLARARSRPTADRSARAGGEHLKTH